MERLHFSPESPYSALEASIHLGRYAIARDLCRGKRVLDAACGEGYGSRMLAEWGAASVDGIDVSEEAVETARARFSHPQVNFHVGDVCSLDAAFGEGRFDLVVSLETIEHVARPAEFLKQIKKVLAPGGTVVVSCPNDHWYYDKGGKNPFHMRQYTFEQFRRLSEKTLGRADSWLLGSLAAGFGVVPIDAELTAAADDDQSAMLRASPAAGALMVPAAEAQALAPENASFFVGVWGAELSAPTLVTFPMSMDESDRSLFGGPKTSEMQDYIARLEKSGAEQRDYIGQLEARRDELEKDDAALRSELKRRETAAAEQRDYVGRLERRRDELESEGKALRGEIKKSEASAEDMRAFAAEQRDYVGRLERRRDELESEGERLRAALRQNEAAAEELRSFIADQRRHLDLLEARQQKADAELAATHEQLAQAQSALAAARESAQSALAAARESIGALEAKDAKARSEIEALQRSLRNTSLRLHGIHSENVVLRESTNRHRLLAEEAEAKRAALEHAHNNAQRLLSERQRELEGLRAVLLDRQQELSKVPWRVVSAYWAVRPLIPLSVLRAGANVIKPAKPAE